MTIPMLEGFLPPLCIIPEELFRNLENTIKNFKEEDETEVRKYAEAICFQYDVPLKELTFKNGLLTNISFPNSGFDYDYGRYVFNNMSPRSDQGIAAFSIAIRYLAQLTRKKDN